MRNFDNTSPLLHDLFERPILEWECLCNLDYPTSFVCDLFFRAILERDSMRNLNISSAFSNMRFGSVLERQRVCYFHHASSFLHASTFL